MGNHESNCTVEDCRDINKFNQVIINMVSKQKEWQEFINLPLRDYRENFYRGKSIVQTLFSPLPNDYQNQLAPLEVLLFIKELRPDALESYIKSFFGTMTRSF